MRILIRIHRHAHRRPWSALRLDGAIMCAKAPRQTVLECVDKSYIRMIELISTCFDEYNSLTCAVEEKTTPKSLRKETAKKRLKILWRYGIFITIPSVTYNRSRLRRIYVIRGDRNYA